MVSARSDGTRRKAAESDRPSALRGFWIESFVGITTVLLLATGLLLYLWIARDTADGRRRLEGAFNAMVAQVTTDLTRVRTTMGTWRTDPDLRAALRQSDNAAALREREMALLRRVPGALGIHLFAPAQTNSLEGIALMSYAGLDLVQKAAQERTLTLIEVHKLGQPDMHLAVAVPVLDESGEQVVGVVHVALPMSLLPNPAIAAGGSGQILFQQVVGATVAGVGATAPTAPPDHTAQIAGTRLHAAAWAPPATFDPWLPGELGGLLLAVLGLIGAVLWRSYRAQRRALLLDCQGFTSLIEDAANHRPLRHIHSRITEVQNAHQETITLLSGLAAAPAPLRHYAPAPVRTAPPAPAGDAPLPPVRDATPAPVQEAPQPPPTADNHRSAAPRQSSIEVLELELPEGLDLNSQGVQQALAAGLDPTTAGSPRPVAPVAGADLSAKH
ncbi:hypothetical protein [uncultured Thiodictyon sp.]|uniref:hypothetical protein n=1 Tax=uncultured Thiodictyon sp. TaxID=1846217 RepID=UPI0025EF5699|nr:hypothetical protein [uncultured Thiodictyon sp.]